MSVLGYKGAFGIQKEVSFKGTVTGTIYWERLTSHNPQSSNNFYRPDLIDNSFTRTKGVYGVYNMSGDFAGDARPSDFFGALLYGFFGSENYTAKNVGLSGTVTELAIHEFTPAQNLPSFRGIYKIGDSGEWLNIRGIKINSLNISSNKDGSVKWSANYIGAYDEVGTSASVVYPVEEPFMFYQCSVTINGVGGQKVESFNLSMNNNLEAIRYLEVARKREASAIERNGKMENSLSLDVNFETLAKYKEFWGAVGATNPEEEADRLNVQISIVGFRYQVTPEIRYRLIIDLPSCEINSAPIPQSTGRVVQKLDLTPVKDEILGYSVKITLYNDHDSAY